MPWLPERFRFAGTAKEPATPVRKRVASVMWRRDGGVWALRAGCSSSRPMLGSPRGGRGAAIRGRLRGRFGGLESTEEGEGIRQVGCSGSRPMLGSPRGGRGAAIRGRLRGRFGGLESTGEGGDDWRVDRSRSGETFGSPRVDSGSRYPRKAPRSLRRLGAEGEKRGRSIPVNRNVSDTFLGRALRPPADRRNWKQNLCQCGGGSDEGAFVSCGKDELARPNQRKGAVHGAFGPRVAPAGRVGWKPHGCLSGETN